MSPRNLSRPTKLAALALTVALAALVGAAGLAMAAAPASNPPANPATTQADAATATATTANDAATADAATPQAQAPAPPVVLSPLHQEIRTLLEQQRAEVDALAARIAAEHDPAQLIELQRAVEASKRKVQVGILEAQLRFARAEGKTDAAATLETALNQMLHPDVSAKPVERAAPEQGSNKP